MTTPKIKPNHFLDITGDICPITYVKVRLEIEKMAPHEILQVTLKGMEPKENVPEAIKELGYQVLYLEPVNEVENIYRLMVLKTKISDLA
tara:strand:- start:1269 stop:1538 length:270 start_codon:yes stop_codon:yes gene_type:complete